MSTCDATFPNHILFGDKIIMFLQFLECMKWMMVIIIIIIVVIIKIIIIIIVIMIWIPTAITVNHCDLDHCPKLDEGGKEGHNRQWGQEANPTQTSCALHLSTCTLAHLHVL